MIQMNHIVKRFGSQTVLSDVTFAVKDKEIFGLLGPSGAGKTTIINILTNQLDADGGSHHTGAAMLETGLYIRWNGTRNLIFRGYRRRYRTKKPAFSHNSGG